jgi:hypothetical protein
MITSVVGDWRAPLDSASRNDLDVAYSNALRTASRRNRTGRGRLVLALPSTAVSNEARTFNTGRRQVKQIAPWAQNEIRAPICSARGPVCPNV